ncbi:hypothetical protein M2271_002457 [Streptomyces sp. LBL]|uniref:hypothetical protein n=1 Tax=Streptomyces sp. LBL TaxID=2940562 RepID=UPI0024770242|nr:hypothetical protein [Streptomyces sp. LBL]MDH6624653.1 hypothetical protein [Streptomyces sp. LBL]
MLMPDSEAESWTVLGDDHVAVAPIERYLAWGEKSPNTVKAYVHDLKDWFVYLVASETARANASDHTAQPPEGPAAS